MKKQFWKKSLEDFTSEEWESICDNCGKCCCIKLQDEDDDEIYFTNVVCKYFNHENCKCKEYARRTILVPECLKIDVNNIDKISWMPKTCSYRILFETKDLPEWHPLITGKPLEEKRSLKGKAICETTIDEDDLEDYIIEDEL